MQQICNVFYVVCFLSLFLWTLYTFKHWQQSRNLHFCSFYTKLPWAYVTSKHISVSSFDLALLRLMNSLPRSYQRYKLSIILSTILQFSRVIFFHPKGNFLYKRRPLTWNVSSFFNDLKYVTNRYMTANFIAPAFPC